VQDIIESTDVVLIGAGLPRTGTLTQKVALERLGVGPCYHWVNVLADLDHVRLWDRAMDGEGPWDEIFAGHHSSADWPGGYFYRELMDVYPDAKVLLSVRDPEKWEPSFRETIVEMSYGRSLMPLLAHARAEVDPKFKAYLELVDRMFWGPEGTFSQGQEPQQLMEQMVAHHERVKRDVPPERLLVWEVGEGWEPLCAFLEVPVPDEPFPHANDRETFLGRVIDGALNTLHDWRERNPAAA
jgi:hypothetical protein